MKIYIFLVCLLLIISSFGYSQDMIYGFRYDIKSMTATPTTPDTLEPAGTLTSSWIPFGNHGYYTVFGYYQIVSGDSLGGTISYTLDKWDTNSGMFSSSNAHLKMGQTSGVTIITFAGAATDTGYKYFDLHVPTATAPSGGAAIQFTVTNTSADTFYIDKWYMFRQP